MLKVVWFFPITPGSFQFNCFNYRFPYILLGGLWRKRRLYPKSTPPVFFIYGPYILMRRQIDREVFGHFNGLVAQFLICEIAPRTQTLGFTFSLLFEQLATQVLLFGKPLFHRIVSRFFVNRLVSEVHGIVQFAFPLRQGLVLQGSWHFSGPGFEYRPRQASQLVFWLHTGNCFPFNLEN